RHHEVVPRGQERENPHRGGHRCEQREDQPYEHLPGARPVHPHRLLERDRDRSRNAVNSRVLNERANTMCRIATPMGLSSPTMPVSFTCGSATTGNGMNIAASR